MLDRYTVVVADIGLVARLRFYAYCALAFLMLKVGVGVVAPPDFRDGFLGPVVLVHREELPAEHSLAPTRPHWADCAFCRGPDDRCPEHRDRSEG
jgi:hypothetical protein